MGPAFVAFVWVIVIGMAFIPTFVIAMLMLHSVVRAFILAAAFMGGAFAAFVSFGFLGAWLLRTEGGRGSEAAVITFATAAAIGGGVLAVYLLGKVSKYPPWRRY
jgi:hypothetical protein